MKRSTSKTWTATLITLMILCSNSMGQIKSDEQVIFFPTAARWSKASSRWIVPIRGWIFEPEEDDLLRSVGLKRLKKMLMLNENQSSTKIFEQRARLFLVDNERGKRISIELADTQFTTNKSTANGHFQGEFLLSNEAVQSVQKEGIINFHAITSENDKRTFKGTVHILNQAGITVISDIDDTIKMTGVNSKKELLESTFLRPFKPVDGMARAYRAWHARKVEFIYVSASPWQLYPPIAEMIVREKFPKGAFVLKRFRLKDKSLLQLTADPIDWKYPRIARVLSHYPQREFILIGDSGEKDPEIYGMAAREFPNQVRRVFIRNITSEYRDSARMKKAFLDIPAAKWNLFTNASSLPLEP